MVRETRIVPDLYFPNVEEQLPTSNVEGKGEHGREVGLEGGKTVDLSPEGFIPIHQLTLGDLPEQIRTEEHLKYIIDIANNIVKVNNNGLSEKRPDDDEFKMREQKTLCGSGFLSPFEGNHVSIITNRHVLFNEEELWESTFDIFYDHHVGDPDDRKKLFKRCGRGNGHMFNGKFTKADIAIALYTVKDKLTAHINEHYVDLDSFLELHYKLDKHLGYIDALNRPPIMCLFSHPLGQPKHISFGEMVDYNMQSRTIHHTAPSKPGSSGGRVVVFAKPLFFFDIIHVGTERVDGKIYKYARVHHKEVSPDLFGCIKAFPTEGGSIHEEKETRPEEIYREASTCVEIACLVAYAPIFGAFLLHTEQTCLAGLDTSVLKPCKQLPTVDSLTSHDLKEVIRKLAELVPSFNVFISSKFDDDSDLVSLLEHSGPCFCQSIVQIMQRGMKLGTSSATECFLTPHKAAAKMSTDSDVTWPWRDGSRSNLGSGDAEENCLLQKCLDLGHKDGGAVMLLLMITKANIGIKELCFRSRVDSSDMTTDASESEWETVYVRTKQTHPCEQRRTKKQPSVRVDSPLQAGEKLSSSRDEEGKACQTLTGDVLIFMHPLLRSVFISSATGPFDEHQSATAQREEDDLSMLYSRCLVFSEHAWQHERQIHPDTECGGQGDSSGNWCRCGRPAVQELSTACTYLKADNIRHQMCSKNLPFSTGEREARNALHAMEQLVENIVVTISVPFVKLLRILQIVASQRSLPPGTFILNALDKLDAFPRGHHSLMLLVASEEAFLYNFRLLARHISQSLQPAYFAFPVSVFGRPGNWPGNVTPPEVQHTAWRQIQQAIMASGFRPAVLLALDEDADRREKLIDLYVDLKQLKWEKRIKPQLFNKYLALSKRDMENHLQTKKSFHNCTHYIVWYATYLICPKIFASRSFVSQP